jgi:hypothetical protein
MPNDMTRQLVARAERDDEFRSLLLSDPKAAIRDEFGIETPDGLQLRVIEAQPDEAFIVVPPRAAAGQLSEEDLAGVAGGFWTAGCTGLPVCSTG